MKTIFNQLCSRSITCCIAFLWLTNVIAQETITHYDFSVGGYYYRIISNTEKTVSITYKYEELDKYDEIEGTISGYTGSVSIPSSVTYNSNDYTVKNIDTYTFDGSTITSVSIPNSILSIGNAAFSGCKNLQSITIPQSVTSIGSGAFNGCIALSSVNIPNGITTINNSTFANCKSLPSIVLPNSVKSIGSYAFSTCSNLSSVTLSSDLTTIGSYAFYGCTNLTSIRIPKSVTAIETYAFYECTGLTSVTVDSPTPITIASGTFSNRTNSTLYVPFGSKEAYETTDYWKDFKRIIEVGNITFADTNVKAICVKNWDTNGDGELSEEEAAAVTDLGTVFSRKYSQYSEFDEPRYFTFDELRYFTGLTSICKEAFYMSDALTSVIIPENVTSIERSAFSNCRNLRSVTIPDNVTTFGDYAFNLTGLTSVTIPSSLVSIGEDAFWGLDNLTDVWCYAEIPPSIIDDTNPFYNSPISSATLHVPAGSLQAYRTTSPWSGFGTIVGLDEEVFTATIMNNIEMTFKVISSSDRTCQVGNGSVAAISTDYEGNVTIPSIVNGYKVIGLGNRSFRRTNINSVTIPNEIEVIGTEAFEQCSQLTSVVVPYGVKTIGDEAFKTCTSLEMVEIAGSVTNIYSEVFKNCSNLQTVVLNNGIKKLGSSMFENCSCLISVDLPNSLDYIGWGSFCNCSSLSRELQ